jgi:hypothetical protein
MLVTVVDKRVLVRLSRRNLRQLDAMLDCRDAGKGTWSVRTITGCLSSYKWRTVPPTTGDATRAREQTR